MQEILDNVVVLKDSTTQSDLSQLQDVKDDAKPLTQPSIIVQGGVQQIGLRKLKPEHIEKYLLMHPVVPRGIEIRSNRMVSRGYNIKPANNGQRAKRAAKEMMELIKNSGDIVLLKNWVQNAYGFGDGYLTLTPNQADNKIVLLRQEHPIFFRIAREKLTETQKQEIMKTSNLYSPDMVDNFYVGYGAMKIDPITKTPSAFTQVTYTDQGHTYIKPIGNELTADQVAHLVFDTWGDEVTGVSVIQYIYLIVQYLLNIEMAAAEATYRTGFTQRKITTEIMTPNELKQLAKNAKEIVSTDIITLPKGSDIENLSPSPSQFPEIHEIFLNLVAIRLGVPKPILTLDGSTINKATMEELTKDMMHDLRADELKVKQAIEEQIFKPACRKLFGENFSEFPSFDFNPFQESEDAKAARNFRISQTLDSLSRSIKTIKELGYTKRAEQLMKFIDVILPEDLPNGKEELDEGRDVQGRDKTFEGETREVKTANTVGRPEGSNEELVKGKQPKSLPAPK